MAGTVATCMVDRELMEHIGVGQERLFKDAKENSVRTRPAVTMPIEEYMDDMGVMIMGGEQQLMIAKTEAMMHGAGVILYPGFLEQISGGRDLFLIPSSVHEWLYIEDRGAFTAEELTEVLRTANREVLKEEDVLSDDLYYYDGMIGEMRRVDR